MKKFLSIMLVFAITFCMIGCSEKTPKGMSDEMYEFAKEYSVTAHKFLDGEIKLSDTKELGETSEKMVDHIQKEYDDGSLVEQYYNDKEVSMLCAELMIYLYTEDNIHEAEDTLAKIDEFLNNK